MKKDLRPQIYILDDDPEFCDSLKVLVETRGYQVVSYTSAKAFLQSLRSKPKGCLLLDLQMPEMSGVEVLRALNARAISLPTIVITGTASTSLKAEALQKGALMVLEKPLEKKRLFDALELALG